MKNMEYKNKIFRNAFYWYTDTIKEYVNEYKEIATRIENKKKEYK